MNQFRTFISSLFLLLTILVSQNVFAQMPVPMPMATQARWGSPDFPSAPPLRINKSSQQMQQESQSARQFFASALDGAAPTRFDLLKFQSPVKSQGKRGTCVAFASIALVEAMYKVNMAQNLDLSEQYAYWASKAVSGIIPNSDGSLPLPFLKSIEKNGVPAEQAWAYEPIGWFDDPAHADCVKAQQQNPNKLPTQCVTNGNAPAIAQSAPKVSIIEPHRVPSSPEAIMGFIQSGMVVEVGADVYDQAWSYTNKTSPQFLAGVVRMPPAGDKLIGGHAFLLVGFDSTQRVFIFKNSWGTTKWASTAAVPGYGTIPFDYISKYADAVVARVKK